MKSLVLLASLLLRPIGAQEAAPPPPPPPTEQPTIRMDVRRVVLYATVNDPKNALPVGDLGRENFRVFDNGKLQELREFERADVPVAIGLVLDNSASMRLRERDVVAAAKGFIRASNPEDQMFVVHFHDDVQFGLPPAMKFTSKREVLDAALDRLQAGGRTALYDAVGVALERLQESKLTKKALVVVSDGGDNNSRRKLDDIVRAANLTGAIFYAIGIYDENDGDANPGALRRLGKATGGQVFFPERLSELPELCANIASDLRNQYMLVYSPSAESAPGSFHKVKVEVKDPKRRNLIVRTRTGYYAEAAQ